MATTTQAAAYDSKVEGNVIYTRVDAAINWMRSNSLWPMPMGLACCAIELMATGASRFDISRFGAEVMRFSPRQADVMIVSGTVTYKMALAVKRIYDQMPEPKWVIAMGAATTIAVAPMPKFKVITELLANALLAITMLGSLPSDMQYSLKPSSGRMWRSSGQTRFFAFSVRLLVWAGRW